MRRVVVTSGCRRRCLGLLYRHLKAQRGHFDAWLLLVGTSDPADVGFVERLAARHPDWIDVRRAAPDPPVDARMDAFKKAYCPVGPSMDDPRVRNVHKFLNGHCADAETVYLGLDDDVVKLDEGFVDRMFAFRESRRGPLLTYCSNIINFERLERSYRTNVWDPAPETRWCLLNRDFATYKKAVCWFGADVAAVLDDLIAMDDDLMELLLDVPDDDAMHPLDLACSFLQQHPETDRKTERKLLEGFHDMAPPPDDDDLADAAADVRASTASATEAATTSGSAAPSTRTTGTPP